MGRVITDIASFGGFCNLNDGLVSWLDASDTALIATENPSTIDGALIQYFPDKSGNTNRFFQNTSGNRPKYYNQGFGTNDLPYLEFGWNLPSLVTFMTMSNGDGDTKRISKMKEHTVVSVIEPLNEPANPMVIIADADSSANIQTTSIVQLLRNGTKEIEAHFGDGTNYSITETPGNTWSQNTPIMIISSYTRGDTNHDININGVEITEVDVASNASFISGTPQNMTIGKYGSSFGTVAWLEAKVAEIRIWNRPLSGVEKILLAEELTAKYGAF